MIDCPNIRTLSNASVQVYKHGNMDSDLPISDKLVILLSSGASIVTLVKIYADYEKTVWTKSLYFQ